MLYHADLNVKKVFLFFSMASKLSIRTTFFATIRTGRIMRLLPLFRPEPRLQPNIRIHVNRQTGLRRILSGLHHFRNLPTTPTLSFSRLSSCQYPTCILCTRNRLPRLLDPISTHNYGSHGRQRQEQNDMLRGRKTRTKTRHLRNTG